jgi:DNA polymerase-3 subunit alpha
LRCARLDRGDPHGDARGDDPRLGAGARAEAGRGPSRRAGSIFDDASARESSNERHHPTISATEFDEQELLRLEKETLGIYARASAERVRADLRRKTDCALMDIERRRDGDIVTVGGIVSGLKQVTTKRGDPMVFATLDDPTGSAEVVVFN